MKKNLFAIILSVVAMGSMQNASAQCDGQRYFSKVFPGSDKTTVTYTELNPNDPTVVNQSMDIYQPTGDAATGRRAILFIHGGSFVGGTRTDGFIVYMCQEFAKRGYVTASIDYRLASGAAALNLLDSTKAYPTVLRSIGDGKAAVRYLKRYSSTLNIDTNWIVLGGESAGAIMGNHIAYVTSLAEVAGSPLLTAAFDTVGGLEGNSGNPGYNGSSVKAVLNLAGSLLFTGLLDAGDTVKPIYSAQGNADNTVPYNCGPVLGGASNVTTCGAGSMEPVLTSLNIRHRLHTFINAPHVPWETDTLMRDTVENEAALFLYQTDCSSFTSGIKEVSSANIGLYPNPSSTQITIHAEAIIESVNVMDNLGRVLSTTTANGTEAQVNVSSLSTGMYIARINLKGNQMAVKTFTVNK